MAEDQSLQSRETEVTQRELVRQAEAELASDHPHGRPWAVTAVGLLLLLQAIGLFGLGTFYFGSVYLLDVWQPLSSLTGEDLLNYVLNRTIRTIVFIPLAALALAAAGGFLRLWRSAWINAMLVQGLTLLIALILYLNEKPWYAYAMMLYGIVMVLYLNYYDVKVAFQPKAPAEEPPVEAAEALSPGLQREIDWQPAPRLKEPAREARGEQPNPDREEAEVADER
jgi:hypothetical protein